MRINHSSLYVSGLSAIALTLGTLSAGAQELRNHDLCRQSRGVTQGAIWTSYGMWEADDKGMMKDRGGWAIGRKPGSINICQDITETGTGEPVLTDGKVTGWTSSGQCRITVSTGDW